MRLLLGCLFVGAAAASSDAPSISATSAPTPKPPSPAPAPGPQKVAGVWPDRFVATMRMAASQPPNVKLEVSLGSRLFYDYPGLQQRWEYWDINDPNETVIFAETWINKTLYELDTSANPPGCTATPFYIYILRPDWPQANEYVISQYLLRQAPKNPPKAGGICYTPDNELADLFQSPAPIGGMTYSWFAFNSSIGEPFRLTGPDNFKKPTYQSVQDYLSFTPLKTHDPHRFDVPAGCKPSGTVVGAEHAEKHSLLGRLRPHISDDRLMAALARARATHAPADALVV